MALDPNKKPTPPFLAGLKGPALNLKFQRLAGHFVTDHSSQAVVSATRVTGAFGFEALIFRTALHEDLDGAPRSYAPPINATNHNPRPGFTPLDHINNATNEVPPTFHPLSPTDHAANSYQWTGIVSMAPGSATAARRQIDNRDFLRDRNGRFPVLQRNGMGADGYYAPQTAITTSNGEAVNPLEVAYAALSNSLMTQGRVRLGDFGLAIRAATGASTPFLYADAGGLRSVLDLRA
jgi:hypothetical protein